MFTPGLGIQSHNDPGLQWTAHPPGNKKQYYKYLLTMR
jgi:hypothetical protein